MKFRNLVLGSSLVFCLSVIILFNANAQLKSDLVASIQDFVAPTIYDRDGAKGPVPVTGLIVFDAQDNAFHGVDKNGVWQPLSSGSSGGGVVTTNTSTTSIESAEILCSGTSSVNRESGSWIDGVPGNVSSGACVIALESGVFNSTPYCWAMSNGPSGIPLILSVSETNATSVTLDCVTHAGADCTSYYAKLFCMGTK